jgi:Protein of unknown function (DUF2891)
MTDFLLTRDLAERFAGIALGHVSREFPNKLDHVLNGPQDALEPRALHPIFFGSFDWHSCVHGYWMLARLRRRFPDLQCADNIVELFDDAFIPEKVSQELAYLSRPLSGGFERTYGWAWLLKLAAELRGDPAATRWAAALAPLEAAFVQRFRNFLPKLTYPIRAGTHASTAFALVLAAEHARVSKDDVVLDLLATRAREWFGKDVDAPAWEPSGDDFLSPTLMEAACMRQFLPPNEFATWFAAFLPRLSQCEPNCLFQPAAVSDRSDGKIVHLDGLSLSRAWCMRIVTAAVEGPDRRILVDAANRHLEVALPHVAGDYMGEHWLATFAVLAMEQLQPDHVFEH